MGARKADVSEVRNRIVALAREGRGRANRSCPRQSGRMGKGYGSTAQEGESCLWSLIHYNSYKELDGGTQSLEYGEMKTVRAEGNTDSSGEIPACMDHCTAHQKLGQLCVLKDSLTK